MSGGYETITTYVIPRRSNVTDRALRYRAAARPPRGAKVCAYCGSRRNVEIDHVNGREEDNRPANLVWACRSCNTAKGVRFARLGRGRKTRQFNAAGDGAQSLGQWVLAHESRLGRSNVMTVDAAVQMIHDTPEYRRKMFGQQIWALRKSRGTDKTAVPF